MQSRLSIPLGLKLRADRDKAHLNLAQKALIDWAKIDDHFAVLDMDCTDGALLNYYSKRYRIRACGMAANNEQLEQALANCGSSFEILRASKTDIPWKEGTFHAVFISSLTPGNHSAGNVLVEIHRIMKPKAQLLVLIPGFHLFSRASGKTNHNANERVSQPQAIMCLLEAAGFEDISMRVSNMRNAVIVAYKSPESTSAEEGEG